MTSLVQRRIAAFEKMTNTNKEFESEAPATSVSVNELVGFFEKEVCVENGNTEDLKTTPLDIIRSTTNKDVKTMTIYDEGRVVCQKIPTSVSVRELTKVYEKKAQIADGNTSDHRKLCQQLEVANEGVNIQISSQSEASFHTALSQFEMDSDSEIELSEDRIERNLTVSQCESGDGQAAMNERFENSRIFHINIPSSATNGVPNPQFQRYPRNKLTSLVRRLVIKGLRNKSKKQTKASECTETESNAMEKSEGGSQNSGGHAAEQVRRKLGVSRLFSKLRRSTPPRQTEPITCGNKTVDVTIPLSTNVAEDAAKVQVHVSLIASVVMGD